MRPPTIQQGLHQSQAESNLKIFDERYKPQLKDMVESDPKKQALWLPLINQLMMLMNVPNFRNQMDLKCEDKNSSFAKSQLLNKFQAIKFTKVCCRIC